MDAFFAVVELLRRLQLKGLPLVIGGRGDPTRGGVVSTASYEARKFGVHSAMPLRTAHKLCPDGVFLGVDYGRTIGIALPTWRQTRATKTLPAPTRDPLVIRKAVFECLGRVKLDRRVRLLGVRVGELERGGSRLVCGNAYPAAPAGCGRRR